MPESTLSVKYADLKRAVGRYLGFDGTASNWTDEENSIVDDIIDSGLRQFYIPPLLKGQRTHHEWSFLLPTEHFTTVKSFNANGLIVSNGNVEVYLTGSAWPAWTKDHGRLSINNHEYGIVEVDNDCVTLSEAYKGEDCIDIEFTLYHDGVYDMPDDFGGLEGKITFSENYGPSIKKVGENSIRELRQGTNKYGKPEMAAVRVKKGFDGTEGQRYEMLLWPMPDDEYTLSYTKIAMFNKLTNDNPYPLGGVAHAETIKASCLAAAENYEEDTKGPKWDYFMQCLTSSYQIDEQSQKIDYFGYNGDNSDDCGCNGYSRVKGLVRYVGGSNNA